MSLLPQEVRYSRRSGRHPIIPIVFALALDPVGSGMVTSLARPGGNVTGLSLQSTDLTSKRLELLREVVPGLRRLAIYRKCRAIPPPCWK